LPLGSGRLVVQSSPSPQIRALILRTLIDTGPLVAFFNRRDPYHRWATEHLADAAIPLWTCEAVISEACFLVQRVRGGSAAIMELLARGALRIAFHLEDHLPHVTRLMARYASVPMSLADACLVCMAEQHADSRVVTLDADFTVYRRHGRLRIPTVIPDRRS
jgi:uncharacterized protein